MFKFIHLTDPHLVAAGQALYGMDPALRLRQAIDSINREHADASFVMVTGDLAHWGEPQAYSALKDELSRLTVPVHLLIGNHDDREHFRAAFPKTPSMQGSYIQYAFSVGGYRHIALDSNEPKVSWGVFCQQRAQWLTEQLATSQEPVFLYIHHPPFPIGLPAMDRISLRAPELLRQAVLPHRAKLRHLFFGHLHRPIAGSWLGIPISTVRATNHQVALDLSAVAAVPGSFEPAQYAVVLASDDATIVHLHDFADRSARFEL